MLKFPHNVEEEEEDEDIVVLPTIPSLCTLTLEGDDRSRVTG